MVRDEIVWVRGGVAGAVHDITIARESLTQHMRNREAILGDKGYQDRSGKFITPKKGRNLTESEGEDNCKLEKERGRVERIIRRVKGFRIVKEPFRNDRTKHAKVFMVCCQLTNIKMIFSPLRK